MRAIVYQGAGGVEVVSLTERPDPTPGPGQVLVRVRAAGLNRPDISQRRGAYPAPPGWPADIPGLEYEGLVESLGGGGSSATVGSRVMGLVGGGAQAELVVAEADELLPAPSAATPVEAAAIPEAFLTAFDALAIRARVRPGERVLIHAVGSGVGTAAVQLAKWMGATVVGTSRTPAKLAGARQLGMDEGIETAAGFAPGSVEPVDVVLDFLGGPALAANLESLRLRGRLVLLGALQGGAAPSLDVGRILRNRLEIIGTVMRPRAGWERAEVARRFLAEVAPSLEAGRLGPVVAAVFPFEKIREAHAAMESNAVFGKIVLSW